MGMVGKHQGFWRVAKKAAPPKLLQQIFSTGE